MLIKCRRGPKKLLHVGCGSLRKQHLPEVFHADEWIEVRFDIDPGVLPDIIGSITQMDAVASESVDGVYASQILEHLFAHEVPLALQECQRVLRPGGFALMSVPNLQYVAEHLAKGGQLEEAMYVSPAGPIAPLDILYGLRRSIGQGNHFMAHKTGFTAQSLTQRFADAGFTEIDVRVAQWNLFVLAYRAN